MSSTTAVGTRFSALAIVAFVLSLVVSIVGAIVGVIALVRINRTGERGRGLAIAAIIIGVVFFVLGLVLLPRELAMQQAMLSR